MHNVVIRIKRDGSVLVIGDRDGDFDGMGKKERASHIEPVDRVLRVLFHACRRYTSETSRIAVWTRSWPCLWRVNLSLVGGPVLAKSYRDREEAIRDEVDWIVEHIFNR